MESSGAVDSDITQCLSEQLVKHHVGSCDGVRVGRVNLNGVGTALRLSG